MGGNAVKNSDPLNSDDIAWCITEINHLLVGIAEFSKRHILGSSANVASGRLKQCNDLDLGLYIDPSEIKLMKDEIVKRFDGNAKKVGSNIAISLYNNNTGKTHQVDIIIGNMAWLKWYYHSHPDSKFKGKYTNKFLTSIIKNFILNKYDFYDEFGDKKTVTKRLLLSPTAGLVYVVESKSHSTGKTKRTNSSPLHRLADAPYNINYYIGTLYKFNSANKAIHKKPYTFEYLLEKHLTNEDLSTPLNNLTSLIDDWNPDTLEQDNETFRQNVLDDFFSGLETEEEIKMMEDAILTVKLSKS